MQKNGFQKVSQTDRRMYGPRKLLVCGYPQSEQLSFLEFLDGCGLGELPVVFVPETDAQSTLKTLLAQPDRSGRERDSSLRRAVIMSGLTERELHALMGGYRQTGFAAQLWATLTPTSEAWTIQSLLEELDAERLAFQRRQS
ncbi:MAG: DUF3783 domain-containing protein [Desulfobacterales bacterium]|nr:DUF3783 domain-containing protein [Desulfobacterales bacterium]